MNTQARILHFALAVTGIIFGFIEISLLMRFLLRLLGANPAASFVNWVYENTLPLLDPFRGIFPSTVIDGQFVIEYNTLFALIIYMLLYFLISELFIFLAGLAADRAVRD